MPVTEIDNGTLPRALWVKMLEVVPRGIAAMRAMPAATLPATALVVMKAREITGKRRSCPAVAKLTAFDSRNTSLKSSAVSVAPMPNMARISWTAANLYSCWM